jgi:peptidoglycan/LPS O-acetylase OafA/YrhL
VVEPVVVEPVVVEPVVVEPVVVEPVVVEPVVVEPVVVEPVVVEAVGDAGISAGDAGISAGVADTSVRRGRLEFLDVLRGVAALMVVFQHGAEIVSRSYLRWSVAVFRPGEFGVVLFFIVSGFIIPASMERYQSLRKFWIGRVFRLFPLYWVVVVTAVAIHALLNRYPLTPAYLAAPRRNGLLNLTMLQDFLHVDAVIGASWSLSYELVFYLLVSILFVAGANRASVPASVVATSSIVLIGLFLPAGVTSSVLGGVDGWRALTLDKGAQFLVMATILIAVLVARRARDRARGWVGVGLVVITLPLLLNQPLDLWFSLSLFALMFAGTVFFRMASGAVNRRTGYLVVGFAVATVLGTIHTWTVPHVGLAGATITAWPEIATFGGAAAVFAVFHRLRARRFPSVLTWLGAISYSVYLVHGVVLNLVPQVPRPVLGVPAGVLTVTVWIGLTVGVSALTYRFVEVPFQEFGKKLIRRLG